jgi:transcriptional regulator with XRE-family HTH domain
LIGEFYQMKEPEATKVKQNHDQVLKKIGKKLAQKRKELGNRNSDAFAYDKDVNRSQYGKYETGSQNLRFSSLLKIINAMDLTIEEFFGEGLDSKVEYKKRKSVSRP